MDSAPDNDSLDQKEVLLTQIYKLIRSAYWSNQDAMQNAAVTTVLLLPSTDPSNVVAHAWQQTKWAAASEARRIAIERTRFVSPPMMDEGEGEGDSWDSRFADDALAPETAETLDLLSKLVDAIEFASETACEKNRMSQIVCALSVDLETLDDMVARLDETVRRQEDALRRRDLRMRVSDLHGLLRHAESIWPLPAAPEARKKGRQLFYLPVKQVVGYQHARAKRLADTPHKTVNTRSRRSTK